MAELIDLVGKCFSDLRVVSRGMNNRAGRARWNCVCACGREKLIVSSSLLNGHTKSCGCLKHKKNPDARLRQPEYFIWHGILSRCENKKCPGYKRYGGAGVTVCARWRNDFDAFLSDMGPRPTPAHSVDRKDNNGNYEPGNCRWATFVEQNTNKNRTRRVVYRGVEMPLTDAVRLAGSIIHYEAAWCRITRCNWSVEAAVETPRQFVSPNAKSRRVQRAEKRIKRAVGMAA